MLILEAGLDTPEQHKEFRCVGAEGVDFDLRVEALGGGMHVDVLRQLRYELQRFKRLLA